MKLMKSCFVCAASFISMILCVIESENFGEDSENIDESVNNTGDTEDFDEEEVCLNDSNAKLCLQFYIQSVFWGSIVDFR